MFDRSRIDSALSRVGNSAKLTGIHGVALGGSTPPAAAPWSRSSRGTTNVPASADLAFKVKVQNQGDVAENDVPVEVTLGCRTSPRLKQTGSIATIAAGQTQSVSVTGFAIPTDALSKVLTLKVKAGPVPEERVQSNNSGEFKFLLQLK